MRFLKLIPTILVKYVMRAFYGLFCLLWKVDEKKVTFASYRADKLKDNLAFVHDAVVERYPHLKRQYLFKKFDSTIAGKISYIFHMIPACYHLATSRYFIIDDYYFPVYVIKPRKEVEIIQLWHSAGALKKFGLSTVGKPFGPSPDYLKHVPIHGNYTKAYVSSSEVVPFFAEAFNMPEERIYPLGVPRTDYFYEGKVAEEIRERFLETYPDAVGKKILLYAPTFRGKSHYQDDFKLPFDAGKMAAELQGEYTLIVHLHPYMQGNVNLGTFGYQVKNAFTIEELLTITDLLITDYSTVFFDYSLLNRPMIFYPYDLDDYKRQRDFYYAYEEIIPGPIAMNTDALIALIRNSEASIDEVSHFRNRFFDYQDGKATERIVQHIFEGKEFRNEELQSSNREIG